MQRSMVNVWTEVYIQLTSEYAQGQQSAVEFIHLYFQLLGFDAHISTWGSKGASTTPQSRDLRPFLSKRLSLLGLEDILTKQLFGIH